MKVAEQLLHHVIETREGGTVVFFQHAIDEFEQLEGVVNYQLILHTEVTHAQLNHPQDELLETFLGLLFDETPQTS